MRRYLNRETILNLFLLIVLIIGGVLIWRLLPEFKPPYHPESKADDGTMVLWQWLENMGYQVESLPKSATDLPDEADMAIILPGQTPVSEDDATLLHDWAAAGHTLVLVDLLEDEAISWEFDLDEIIQPETTFNPELMQELPLLPEAPAALTSPIIIGLSFDTSNAPAALSVLNHNDNAGNRSAAVVQQVGDGVVWHLGPGAAPTNEALQGDMGYLVPAMLRTIPENGVIVMTLYRPLTPPMQMESPTAAPSLLSYFFKTAWGRAILLAGLMLLLFLILQGRRLGPALPADHNIRRREAAEYVEAIAQLKRRARQRDSVVRHQNQRLRTALANVWQIDASLPAGAFIDALQHSDVPPSPELLDRIHHALSGLKSNPSEAELVQLAAEIDAILHEIGANA